MKWWILWVGVVWVGLAPVCFAQRTTPVLCVGIGAARISGDGFPWRSRVCAAARTDAEAAFRELVPAAAGERYLYSRPMRWDRPAVLLTDGVTDNRSIPVRTRILRECSELVSAGEQGLVVWMAGIGEINGSDSWLYDRMGNVMSLSSVMDQIRNDPRSRVVLRAYADGNRAPAHTLYVCDAGAAAAFVRWTEAGGPGRGVLPGLSGLLETITPVRMDRVREQLERTGMEENGRVWLDLGQSLERAEQVVDLAVDMQERPVFRTRRRPGPFFTIVEEETDEVIGMKIQVNVAQLQQDLSKQLLSEPVVNEVVQRIEAGAAASFEAAFNVGLNTYQLVYDRAGRELRIRYLD